MRSNIVAVAFTLSDREKLTAEEETSPRHLTHFLGNYDCDFVASDRLARMFGLERFRGTLYLFLAARLIQE